MILCMENFVKLALKNGGAIKPLLVDSKDLCGPSLTNPTIININGKIIVNIRNVNYTLYHSELSKFEHMWGPLSYIHPENDMHLRTVNYIAELDDDLNMKYYTKVDTSLFDTYQPQWDFVGLEDARLVLWMGQLFLIGVRRDLDTIGTGRMELSRIELVNKTAKETFRYRIPGPPPDNEYCMKNCTPIEDQPFHLLKWTNPTSIMEFNPNGSDSKVYEMNEYTPGFNDMRGGSQVIKYKGGYLTLIHETQLYNSEQGRKDATYRHRFVTWDKDFKNQKFSPLFSFMNMKIEFSCGMCIHNEDFLITFGAQDNAAYVLKIPQTVVDDFIGL